MSNNDLLLLDKLLEQRRDDIGEGMADDEFFELFSAEQVLKDDDLSYEEPASKFPSVSIDYAYVTRGSEAHPNVERTHRKPSSASTLRLAENPISTGQEGFVCLVTPRDYPATRTDTYC